jgi:hypothetical protein
MLSDADKESTRVLQTTDPMASYLTKNAAVFAEFAVDNVTDPPLVVLMK